MNAWAQKKAELALDWRMEWRHIAQWTEGNLSPEVLALVLVLDDQYKANDRSGFLQSKEQLKKRLLPAKSSSTSTDSSGAMPEKYLEASSPADGPTLSAATQVGLF